MAAEAPTPASTPHKPEFKAREEGDGEGAANVAERTLSSMVLSFFQEKKIFQMSSYISFVMLDYLHGQFYCKRDWKVSV